MGLLPSQRLGPKWFLYTNKCLDAVSSILGVGISSDQTFDFLDQLLWRFALSYNAGNFALNVFCLSAFSPLTNFCAMEYALFCFASFGSDIASSASLYRDSIKAKSMRHLLK